MKSSTLATILSCSAALAGAQITNDPASGTFVCPVHQGVTPLAFCAGDSLETNIIIRCEGVKGQPGNCDDNLAGIPPAGVKISALCYESSTSAGDAACSYNGTAYPDDGNPFLIPSKATTTTSSLATGSTGYSRKSLFGTQSTKNISIVATGNTGARATGTAPLNTVSRLYPLRFTTYKAGVKTAVPGTKISATPIIVTAATTIVATTVITAAPDSSSGTAVVASYPVSYVPSKPVSVSPDYNPPVGYGPVETSETSVIVAGRDARQPPKLRPRGKAILGARQYNATSPAGSSSGSGGPAQTSSPVPPISNGSSAKGTGMWLLLALVVAMFV